MAENTSTKLKNFLKLILCSVSLIFSVVPGYDLLGNLFLQVFVTLVISLAFLVIFDFIFKCDPVIFSSSLIVMTVFWIIFALVKQFIVHYNNSEMSFNWFHLFYYDRPALLFVVFFVCILYFIIKLLFKNDDANFIEKYIKFIRTVSATLMIYYTIILFYSFYLVRKITWIRPEINLKPFDMIKFTFSRGYIDYELIFLFLGNIAIFLPLGIFTSMFIRKKLIIAVLPVIISLSIEVSQYFLGNGHPDIDDLILNVIGFYIGVATRYLLDYLIAKFTKDKLTSFLPVK